MTIQDLDIRWKQRFENFTKVKNQLELLRDEKMEDMKYVEIAGWIHLFDLTFELAYKTLRDYMISQGETEHLDFPRDIINIGTER